MARKQRIDSASAAVVVVQASAQELHAPDHVPLTDKDAPFWRSIIAEKPKAEWTAHDLEIAALLAMSLRKMGEQEVLLDNEGPVITTVGGNLAANPRCRIVADLHARAMKYRQSLGIHNRGKAGEHRDVVKRRAIASAVEAANPAHDDLLASPAGLQ